MKDIYILLTRTGTALGSAIKLYTRGSWSHASIALDENLEELYSFSRKYTWNPFIGTFMEEDIEGGVFAVKTETQCLVLKVRVTDEQYASAEDIISRFKANRQAYGYSVLGLIYFMLGRPRYSSSKYTCAGFVTHVIEGAQVAEFEKHGSLVQPDDFMHLDSEVVYQGLLRDYRSSRKWMIRRMTTSVV